MTKSEYNRTKVRFVKRFFILWTQCDVCGNYFRFTTMWLSSDKSWAEDHEEYLHVCTDCARDGSEAYIRTKHVEKLC